MPPGEAIGRPADVQVPSGFRCGRRVGLLRRRTLFRATAPGRTHLTVDDPLEEDAAVYRDVAEGGRLGCTADHRFTALLCGAEPRDV
jgi:hypothetical protein